jgi:hypothetical protein
MKKIKIFLAFTIVAGLLLSCEKENDDAIKETTADSTLLNTNGSGTITGTGSIISKSVEASNFTEVELKGFGEVEINSGSDYKVEVSDYQNLVDYVRITVTGEKMIISYKDNISVKESKLKISITMPEKLSKAIVSGAGNININSGLTSAGISLIISGAGNIYAAGIAAENVNLLLTGAGIIEAKGTAGKLILGISGSGTIKCKDLVCNNVDCEVKGAGTVLVNAKDNLKVYAMGVGSLTYYGNPALDINKGLTFSLKKG